MFRKVLPAEVNRAVPLVAEKSTKAELLLPLYVMVEFSLNKAPTPVTVKVTLAL